MNTGSYGNRSEVHVISSDLIMVTISFYSRLEWDSKLVMSTLHCLFPDGFLKTEKIL